MLPVSEECCVSFLWCSLGGNRIEISGFPVVFLYGKNAVASSVLMVVGLSNQSSALTISGATLQTAESFIPLSNGESLRLDTRDVRD